jgi:UDP-N-acetylglucosamine/UDP-N-acetylgalactosamine 4-epimerase
VPSIVRPGSSQVPARGALERVSAHLTSAPRSWLVTGAAGFIGSHLVERLLQLGQRVVGLDNFATGRRENLDLVAAVVGPESARRFTFLEGDVQDADRCAEACRGVDFVLHQAALGSVPRSVADPANTHRSNVNGFLTMLIAARDAGVERFVYASSSSVYGDHPALPKREDQLGRPLSPYAVSKLADELYADVFARTYGMRVTGLRYFNVFGPRQDPEGPYAAAIPRWVGQILRGEPCVIFGDGETSRDFSFVANVVQANLLAAAAEGERPTPEIFNVACGDRTTLNEIYAAIRDGLAARGIAA